jgi:hypothetical protein
MVFDIDRATSSLDLPALDLHTAWLMRNNVVAKGCKKLSGEPS